MKYIIIVLKLFYLRIIYFIGNKLIFFSEIRAIFYNHIHPDFMFNKKVKIRNNITFYSGSRLEGKLIIGNNSFINDECFIDYSSKVIIGSNVNIGMRTLLLSSSHKIGNIVRCGKLSKKVTIIKDNVWIGAATIIYPGVIIEEGCVISAGEIVNKNIPKNKLLKNGKLIDIVTNEKKND